MSSGPMTKVGMRDGEKCGKHRPRIGGGIVPHRGPGAEPDATSHRDDKGDSAQRRGDGKGLRQQLVHRAIPVFGGKAQVAVEEISHVAPVLLPERAVQIVVGEQFRLDLRGNLALAVERAARCKPDQQKGERDRAIEHQKKRRHPAQDKGDHAWAGGGRCMELAGIIGGCAAVL